MKHAESFSSVPEVSIAFSTFNLNLAESMGMEISQVFN
jgi:hypothetical protein